jgi:ABC-type nitrate/sulfonate/bicarbonate transport system permease component
MVTDENPACIINKMGIGKIDRTKMFLGLVLFLYFWDVAYFVGLRNPYRFPHPFSLFRTLGDIEFLRGFPAMLREVIFSFVSGSLIGLAVGKLVLYSSWLSGAIRRFLPVAMWFPLFIILVVMAPLALGIAAVSLCTGYYYIAARSSLGLDGPHAWNYAAREAILLALLVSLISQVWVPHWQWFIFHQFMNVGQGLGVFAMLFGLVGFINWCFRSNFELTASRRAAIISQEIDGKAALGLNRLETSAIYEFTLLSVACLVIWLFFGTALTAAYNLFLLAEIWGDIGLSLLEVIGGIVLGGLAGQGMFVVLSHIASFRKLLFPLLQLTHISAIVLWLIVFVVWLNWFGHSHPSFVYFWHKVIVVGCLTFFTLFQALWGFRDRPIFYRLLLAVDDALPIAFVAMVFGEAYAATQGLGFLIVVASAMQQSDKAIAGCLVTFALMAGLSFVLRWTAKRLYSSVELPPVIPA